MRNGKWLPVVVGLTLGSGCIPPPGEDGGGGPPPERVETLTLYVSDGSDGLTIDRGHHDTAVVFRGDRVEWLCECRECPKGEIEFTIDPPHLVIDFGLSEAESYLPVVEAMGAKMNAVVEAREVGRLEHPLFDDWTPGRPGSEWHGCAEAIRSPPVRPGAIDHGLWKFGWRVRYVGDPESEVVWDPHIFGHPTRAY